jgi:plastocyanin
VGAAVAVLPALASGGAPASTAASSAPMTGSFTAVDYAWNAAGGGNTVTIAPGGTVSFSYPSGGSIHNAAFDSAQPTSCTQTAGASTGSVPPLPNPAAGQGWSGSCTFNTPGTYTFHCQIHSYMTGTIVVGSGGGTTTTTTTPPTTTTYPTTTTTTTTNPPPPPPTTTTTPYYPPPLPTIASTQPQTGNSTGSTSSYASGHTAGGSPLASAARAVAIAGGQRGSAVRGSVAVSRAGAGGSLEVDVFVTRAALSSARRGGPVRIGLLRTSLHAGIVRFSVALNGAGKRALSRHRRLAVTVKLSLVSPRGARASATRQVVLRHG